MKKSSLPPAMIIAFLLISSLGCFKMDALLYNPNTTITSYGFQDADFEWAWEPPASFRTDPGLWHGFTVSSTIPGENSSETIHAVYIGDTNRIATDTVIVYCHGNSTHLDAYVPWLQVLSNAGGEHRFGVLAMDYRGYGLSTGSPTEAGLYADVDACLEWAKARGLTGDRLVMYGMSMGTAAATELTAKPRALTPYALILEAPFASGAMLGQSSTNLGMPGGFFTQLEIDNAEEIRTVDEPFLWFHGTDDDFIDYEAHGQTVWNNYAGSRGLAVPVEGAFHSNVPFVYGCENHAQTVADFITGQ